MTADTGCRSGCHTANGSGDGGGGGTELDRGYAHFGPQQWRRRECFALIGRRAAGTAGPRTAAQSAGRGVRESAEPEMRLIRITGGRW